MKVVKIGEFKARFSDLLKYVVDGNSVVISFGKRGERKAVLIPYTEFKRRKRKLGALQSRGKLHISRDWKMTAEELLGS